MPNQTMPNLSIEKKHQLRNLILRYFTEARYARGMSSDTAFVEFSTEEILHARLAAANLGLINRANFGNAGATAYVTTEAGIRLLEGEGYGI